MRSLAISLVLWLCARFDIVPLDETRKFMGRDAVARGQRWEAFATEEGGLYDMIEAQQLLAFEAYGNTRPGDHAEKEYLALQHRSLQQLRARVDSIIASGKIEAKNNEQKERLSARLGRKS